MAKVLVTEHESGARKELDTDTGELRGLPALPTPDVSNLERLWPQDSRGRWQTLGGITFVLYRVGTRLHFRAGDQDVELGPNVSLELTRDGKHNDVVAKREGATLLRARYPSQLDRRVDPFIDPWEEDDDLDLVLFATKVAADPERRQAMFATDEERRHGEITPRDVTNAVRAAVTTRFPRTRALAIFRELERWWWKWQPEQMDGWGPRCTLCNESPISRMMVGAKKSPALSFTMEARREEADLGFCEWCVTSACRFLATAPSTRLRADAALADMTRAVRDRGELRDEEIAARLASMCAALPPDPVIPAGPPCTVCSAKSHELVAGAGDARVCAGCIAQMRAVWRRSRDDWNLLTGGTSADSRWEAGGGYILVLHHAHRLHIPLSPHPEMPIVISPDELARWDTPYDDVALDAQQRALVESQIRAIVRKRFQRDVDLRD